MHHGSPTDERANRPTDGSAPAPGRLSHRPLRLSSQTARLLSRAARGRDRGSISIWIATGGLVMVVLVGMAVDLSGQVYAQQHARDIARQAARAARTYLAASDVTGSASVNGGNTVVVNTTAVYRTKFLNIIGIAQLTVTGHAQASITRVVQGVAR